MKYQPLTNQEHEDIARRSAEHLVELVTEPEVVGKITEAWSGALDKMIGRGMRRLGFYLIGVAIVTAAVKFEALKKLFL